jgi:hypothetical protein
MSGGASGIMSNGDLTVKLGNRSQAQEIYRLMYSSIATSPVTANVLTSILEASRRNNGRNHVTGHLMSDERLFVQLLEGKKADVDAVFARIERDPRHSGVLVLLREQGNAPRLYPDWNMGHGLASRQEMLDVLDRASARAEPGLGETVAAAVQVLRRLLEVELASPIGLASSPS